MQRKKILGISSATVLLSWIIPFGIHKACGTERETETIASGEKVRITCPAQHPAVIMSDDKKTAWVSCQAYEVRFKYECSTFLTEDIKNHIATLACHFSTLIP